MQLMLKKDSSIINARISVGLRVRVRHFERYILKYDIQQFIFCESSDTLYYLISFGNRVIKKLTIGFDGRTAISLGKSECWQ